MKTHVARRLSSLTHEISATRAMLDRLRDSLERRATDLDDRHLRMLIAETPQADLDLHAADAAYRRVRREVGHVEAALEALRSEERRLHLLAAGG